MIISRIALRNWRNFQAVDLRLSERTFIVGPNASGKSNFLDAVRFLRDIAKPGGGLQRAVRERGGLSKIRSLAARRDPVVQISVDVGEEREKPLWTYSLEIKQQVRGRRQLLLHSEKVWKRGELILDRPDADDRNDELKRTQTHLEQIASNERFRGLARFFESIRYLHLVPQVLKHPDLFRGAAEDEDPFGKNFLEVIARTPEKTRKSRLSRIEKALRQAVPNLKNLTDTKDEAGVPHLEAVYEHWRPNAGRQREDQFSDGTLRLIGLFWSLLDGDAPLLLEEPELSLHSAIVDLLPALFAKLQRHRRGHRQLIISTHSFGVLNDAGIGAEEIIMLTPVPEGTKAASAADSPDIRAGLEGGLTVADLVLPKTAPRDLTNMRLFD